MIDHIFGRPSPSWKRNQVFLVLFFWIWRIIKAKEGPPKILWLPRLNRRLKRFTPWQLILSTLTAVYVLRNLDKMLGLDAPEPLRNLYTPDYFRATWIVTGLDAGFATAMTIRPKWLRDICSLLFAAYYILFPSAADEKLRRFRAVPTVELLRATWNKTSNPYLRMIQNVPKMSIRRKILLPRPKSSSYDRPITGYLYFAPPERELRRATELILDFPGGGFVAMSPEHHEERLRYWAVTSGRPVLSIDYGKAPEYPYPFAIDELFDVYRLLVESAGHIIGMSGKTLSVILSGDSAGGALVIGLTVKIIELKNGIIKIRGVERLPLPTGLVLTYPVADFNFASWMSSDQLRILRAEQSSSNNIPGMREFAEQKDHLHRVSPLSMVPDRKPRKLMKRSSSWKDTLRGFTSGGEDTARSPLRKLTRSFTDDGSLADAEGDDEEYAGYKEEDKPIEARVKYRYENFKTKDYILRTHSALERKQEEMAAALREANNKAIEAFGGKEKRTVPIGTRLTMSSRAGYFQDRIISPSMMRAMAILYIGPHRNPDFATDYHISPILTPGRILAQFPPLMIQCGEKDPFVDDSVIFAGRVREAKRARKIELELALSGKSARFGEDRQPQDGDGHHVKSLPTPEMERERDKLTSESEYDWVQLVLLADWSHGYLQMPTLLPRAKVVIDDLAEWMVSTFQKYRKMPAECDEGVSETEASDTGITFVSKRKGSSGSDGAGQRGNGRAGTPRGEEDQKQASRIAGHTITEMELVRRRRLQDAHLFDSPQEFM